MAVMALPETFKNWKLEVLIFPTEEQETEKADIESVVQSLIGAIPATDMSLAEMQEERRHKYETADWHEYCAGRPFEYLVSRAGVEDVWR